MRKYYIICVTFLLTVNGSASGQTLRIDSCYALAVKNYPFIRQYDLIQKTKEYTLSNASKAYLPQVSLTAIEGYIFGGLPTAVPSDNSSHFKFIGVAQLNQTIWDGGATKTQKQIIAASSETEKASVNVALYDLRSRVNDLYFGILLADQQLIQLQIQDTMLQNNIHRAEQLNQNGLAYKTDVDEMKVERLKLNQQKTEYTYTRDGFKQMLSLLIGIKVTDQIILEKPMVSLQPDPAEINRPELSYYKSQQNLVNAEAGMQKVNLMPKIGLLGAGVMIAPGLSLGNGKISSIGVAGVSASWNISGLYKNSNEKQLTLQQLNKIKVQEETFLFNTHLQMSQSSSDIFRQQAVLRDDDEIVQLRQTIREEYQIKYDNGKGPLLDLLNASVKESEARALKALHEMQLLKTLYSYKTISGN